MVRALVSHQCGQGSISGADKIMICGYGLSSFLVPVPISKGFSLGTLVFLPPPKTNIPKFQFDLERVDETATLWKPLKFPCIYLFILFFDILSSTLKKTEATQ